MSNGFYNVPKAVNEPVKEYAPGSPERTELLAEYKRMYNTTVDVPMYIGNKRVFTDNKRNLTPPHEHGRVIGTSNYGGEQEVHDAIDAAIGGTPASTAADTLLTANDMHLSAESGNVTIAGATKGEAVLLQIARDISDTLSADAKLIGINITWTADEATKD